jgi:hypothetical protein
MTALLHRLGYRLKKPKLLPGKAPAPEVQEAFVADLRMSMRMPSSYARC